VPQTCRSQRSIALDRGKATFALNAGVWFRRGLLLMVSPVCGHRRRYQAETPLIDLFKFARPALFWAAWLVRLLQANTIFRAQLGISGYRKKCPIRAGMGADIGQFASGGTVAANQVHSEHPEF